MNIGELTLGSYLLAIWMVDMYYSTFFVVYERRWLSTFQCYIFHQIFFNAYLMSPLMQCFLTLTRLMVTLYPMNSGLRKRTFALWGIMCIWLLTGIVSIFKTLFMYFNDIAIPFRLCISLIDPAHISSFSNMLVWVLFFYYCYYIFVNAIHAFKAVYVSQDY